MVVDVVKNSSLRPPSLLKLDRLSIYFANNWNTSYTPRIRVGSGVSL